jgi:glucose-6-phosphate-specific signal transduction histidine kinase
MSRLSALSGMLANAVEKGWTKEAEEIRALMDRITDEQRQAFERDRPKIMDELERGRRNMMIIH